MPQVKLDRTFNCNKKHAMAIWRFIQSHDNGVTNFHFEIAADLLDQEEIELWARCVLDWSSWRLAYSPLIRHA